MSLGPDLVEATIDGILSMDSKLVGFCRRLPISDSTTSTVFQCKEKLQYISNIQARTAVKTWPINICWQLMKVEVIRATTVTQIISTTV